MFPLYICIVYINGGSLLFTKACIESAAVVLRTQQILFGVSGRPR